MRGDAAVIMGFIKEKIQSSQEDHRIREDLLTSALISGTAAEESTPSWIKITLAPLSLLDS